MTVIDIHNGGNNALKNAASARLVPIHSELVRAGLLRYRDALPKDGPLFPGLERRASKGGKIGCRVGELFRDKLEAFGPEARPPLLPLFPAYGCRAGFRRRWSSRV